MLGNDVPLSRGNENGKSEAHLPGEQVKEVQKTNLSASERSAERTKAAVLAAATEEFCAYGLKGARIENISRQSGVNKRMIYEYFQSKETLYERALEAQYRGIRNAEKSLRLDVNEPRAAMKQLIEFTFDYYRDHPLFVRFISIENINRGGSLSDLNELALINSSAVELVSSLLNSGEGRGVFRPGIDPAKLYMLISAAGFTYFSNRYTWSIGFKENYNDPHSVETYRTMLVELFLRYLAPI